MATGKISNESVDRLRWKAPVTSAKPHSHKVFLWDTKLPGFGVAALRSGKKVYVAQFRADGKLTRMTIGVHGRLTPKEARDRAKEVLGDVAKDKNPIEERRKRRAVRTFKAVSDDFMKLHAKAKRKGRTATEYASLLRLHLIPAIGSRRIEDVDKDKIVKLHDRLSPKSPGAANRCLSLVSSIWNWAAKREEPGVKAIANPAKGIARNPEESRERFLTSEEIGRLGDTLRLAETKGIPWEVDDKQPNAKHIAKKNRNTVIDKHAAAAIRLLVLTGARVSEILTAKWDYVDWERGLLLLPDSKTGKKAIYLPAPALALLTDLPRIKDNPFIVAGRGPRKRKGTPESKKPTEGAPRADLKKPWAAVSKHAGLEGVRLHDLRHSFASIGAGASLGLPIIGKLLGHTQPATTARYSHLDADPLHRAANVIGSHIAAALEGRKGELIELRTAGARATRPG
jgi:integrase